MPLQTGIALLNYNGGQDSVACLESLLALNTVPPLIVVCDNGSQDDSWDILCAWAFGLGPGRALESTACAVWGAATGVVHPGPDHTLVLLRTSSNLGFAAGCNVGLRYLLDCPKVQRIWLLNNDTLVQAMALDHLTSALDAPATTLPWGLACGPILYLEKEQAWSGPVVQARPVVQAYGGGRYYPALGSSVLNGNGQVFDPAVAAAQARQRRDFPLGASMLISRAFVEDVGLLDEDFFLYFEEIDWMLRARGRFALAYAPRALVWHKEGATSGADQARVRHKSERADFHFQRSRLLCTRKHYPWYFPLVLATLLITAVKRLLRGQPERLAMLWRCVREACHVRV